MKKSLLIATCSILSLNTIIISSPDSCNAECSRKKSFAGIKRNKTINESQVLFNKIKTAVLIGGILGAGQYASKLNDTYANINQAPDLQFNIIKTGLLGTAVCGIDYQMGDHENIYRDLGKVGALAISMLAASPAVAPYIRYIPLVGSLLTDHPDAKGNEYPNGAGASARLITTYMLARGLVEYLTQPAVEKNYEEATDC